MYKLYTSETIISLVINSPFDYSSIFNEFWSMSTKVRTVTKGQIKGLYRLYRDFMHHLCTVPHLTRIVITLSEDFSYKISK